MKIRELMERISYTLLQGSLDQEVTGICHDNRRVQQGDAFLCIAGARFDTHSMVEELARAGAVLLVVEREVPLPLVNARNEEVTVIQVESTRRVSPLLAAAFYGYPAEQLLTIGITGSKGKTTVTHMLADILRCAGFCTATLGTNGAILPEGRSFAGIYGAAQREAEPCAQTPGYLVYELSNTTPDAMEVQMYLRMMVEAGCTHAVIEVSSQGMKQHRVDGCDFDYAIWTNIETGDHIGPNEHQDFEEYLSCKAMLINSSRRAFLNADDPHLEQFLRYVTLPEDRLTFFGYRPEESKDSQKDGVGYWASAFQKEFCEETRSPQICFQVSHAQTSWKQMVNLPGFFNLYNALAAACVADALEIPPDVMNQALTHLQIKGRFDIVFRNEHFSICVDFAHNGYSTRNHLEALREYHPKRLVCVFGADGNRSRYRRYEMGEASARLADLSIVTAGHNRYETFEQILADIEKGIDKVREGREEPVSYLVIPKRQEAIRYAIEHAQEGDMITILGLGHESYQEENGIKYPHSDTEYVRSVCRSLGLME